jgi:hypothetical protein
MKYVCSSPFPTTSSEMPEPSTNRLLVAMILYGVLAASAFFTLDGDVRVVVLILFIGLALKTWAVHERQKLEAADASEMGQREAVDDISRDP